MDFKNKVILVLQGQGQLFHHKTAEALSHHFKKVYFLTGYAPEKNNIFLKLLSFLFKKDIFKRLSLRNQAEIKYKVIQEVSPEILYWSLKVLFKFAKRQDEIDFFGWKLYGLFAKKYLNKTKADIAHIRSGAGGGNFIEECKRKNIKVIVDHSIIHPSDMKKYLAEKYEQFDKKLPYSLDSRFWSLVNNDCLKADLIIANSELVKDSLINNGINASKVKVCYLGVDKIFLQKRTSRVNKNKLTLLFVGAWGLRKGADCIINCLEIFENEGIDYELTVIGPNENEIIIPHRLIKSIKFIQSLPYNELPKYYQNNDFFIFPSNAEGSSRAVMEAMGCGMNVITTKTAGSPISNNINGFIFDRSDSYSMANKIIMLDKSENCFQKISINAHKLIKENYGWKNYKENMLTIYEEFLRK